MFCSHCGVKASGKFCFQCGSALQSPDATLSINTAQAAAIDDIDWEHEVCYDKIIRVEEVRATIARHATSAPKGLSGEALLALYDKFVSSPVPLERLASIVQPIYDSWGIRTGKERVGIMEVPIGRAIARTLCSLAKHGQVLENADQTESGCILSAELPSSVCSLQGKLMISLSKHGGCTKVEAMTNIPGQMYDWGKSQRGLDALFNDLKLDMGLPTFQPTRKAA